jgi:hypothetical protein
MRVLQKSLLIVVASFLLMPAAWAADSLVVRAPDGSFKPGVAKAWHASDAGVVFELNAGVDGNQTATVLSERLAQAKVSFSGGQLTVSGLPLNTLLEQLSILSLSGGESDPLAALTGLGGGVPNNEATEGGGSIRASKPTPIPPGLLPTAAPAEPDTAERLECDVLDVQRGAFPQVTLKLKVRRGPAAGPLKARLAAGKSFDSTVVLAEGAAAVDWASPLVQRNLAAFYLKKGDHVVAHAREQQADHFAIDWLERK